LLRKVVQRSRFTIRTFRKRRFWDVLVVFGLPTNFLQNILELENVLLSFSLILGLGAWSSQLGSVCTRLLEGLGWPELTEKFLEVDCGLRLFYELVLALGFTASSFGVGLGLFLLYPGFSHCTAGFPGVFS
jgi:hypothetical protein